MKATQNRWRILAGVLATVALVAAVAVQAAGPSQEGAEDSLLAGLSHEELGLLVQAGGDLRQILTKLRATPLDRDTASKRATLKQQVEHELDTVLTILGMTREEFVSLLDSEGGISSDEQIRSHHDLECELLSQHVPRQ